MGKKTLNFIKAEKRGKWRRWWERRRKGFLILFPMLLASLYLSWYFRSAERAEEAAGQAEEISHWLNSEEVKAEMAKQESLLRKLELLKRYEQEEGAIKKRTEEYGRLTYAVLAGIESVMGDAVELVWDKARPLRYEEGSIIFMARTDWPLEASSYVQRLEGTGLFETVGYDGFSQKEDAGTGEPYYLFQVTCHMSHEDKGEEEP